MGTRGAYGFRVNGIDKVTYLPDESQPDGFGLKMVSFVGNVSKDNLRSIAEDIQVVDDTTRPSAAWVAQYSRYARTGQSRPVTDWPELLNRAQGDLVALGAGLRHMVDARAFLLDSVSCEWAYIVDVDTDMLEIYRGFQKHLGSGRYNHIYARHREEDGSLHTPSFTGVALLQAVPIAVFRALSKEDGKGLLLAIHTLCLHAEGKLNPATEDDQFDKAKALFKRLMAVDTALLRLQEELPETTADQHSKESVLVNAEDLLREIHDRTDALGALPADLTAKVTNYFRLHPELC